MSTPRTNLAAPFPEDGHGGQVTWSRCPCEWHRAALRFGRRELTDVARMPGMWERLTWSFGGASIGAWRGLSTRSTKAEGSR